VTRSIPQWWLWSGVKGGEISTLALVVADMVDEKKNKKIYLI
jgi:hypothetical protein